MNSLTLSVVGAVAVQVGLGIAVFLANRRRKANQGFFILSLSIGFWLTSFYFAFQAKTLNAAEWAIRCASIAGPVILASFNLLRLTIRESQESWGTILRHCRAWLIGTAIVSITCLTKWFLHGAQLHENAHGIAESAPTPEYGPGVLWVYTPWFAIAVLALLVSTVRDLRRTKGSNHAELAFIIISGILVVALSLPPTIILAHYVSDSFLLALAPFRAVIFSAVVAYGVATRRTMEVGILLRRIMSYTLLTLYLLALYGVVWWLIRSVLNSAHFPGASSVAHVAAGIVIAFAMAPARGLSRRLAERLFISTERLDFRTTVSKATEILSSITTLRDLLQRFVGTIADAFGADSVAILLPGREAFITSYAFSHEAEAPRVTQLGLDEPITNYLKAHREAVVLDELNRVRPTPEIVRLARRMRELRIAVAVGIFSREHLAGIMILGPRLSNRIYGSVEQDALQVLCGQLSVAVDNAQLFTQVQNAKIYNETLLQNLTTGVIAAGADERVTVFNNEAGQITGLPSTEVLDQPIEWLPAPLRDALRETLKTGEGRENLEVTLPFEDNEIAIRISTSVFHGQSGQALGALMVLTDVTALKRLEHQIRRSDRLASLGTLSAGMAHEIKNPLVSIKTFAQLLPERYADSDFRETFSNLIGHEIDRIDSLVNQLLRFARPAKPNLEPRHVHQILEKSLLLVGHRLYQKDIKLNRLWGANVDTIRADADQLEQVFLNFFINAMDAMKNGGELNVSTEISSDEHLFQHKNGDQQQVLRVTIRDTGEGIPSDNLAHVFDPFFTTKDYGTGLGLSVVHGIIQEHGGQIEVESELKKGTSFHIMFPLVRFDSEVVAA